MIDCRYHELCSSSTIHVTSEVKQQVLKLDVMYVYDGTELFVLYKTSTNIFGTHLEIDLIQNSGRYGFFERIMAATQGGIKPESKHFIIDLEKNTLLKPTKKTMADLFKNYPDLMEQYNNDHDKRKLINYLTILNKKLGY